MIGNRKKPGRIRSKMSCAAKRRMEIRDFKETGPQINTLLIPLL